MVQDDLWLNSLTTWMEKKESNDSEAVLGNLTEDLDQISWETDSVLESSNQLETAFSKVLSNMCQSK